MLTLRTNGETKNPEDILEVPFADFRGLYYNEFGKIAHRPHSLIESQPKPDLASIFGVLQFGAIIPPFSPWQNVFRFMPGYKYEKLHKSGPNSIELPTYVATFDTKGQADEICRIIDRSIRDLPDPIVLFSGGVDSGLIAARLAALGHRDSLLLNYAFSENDPESQLAEAMAKHLCLKFERIIANNRNLTSCLNEPGRIYPQPFGDSSTVPTSELAYAVIERLAGERRPILDGTGADGAFGMTGKVAMWKRVLKLPSATRYIASSAYTMVWHRKGKL